MRIPRAVMAPYCDAIGPVSVVGNLDGIDNEIAGAPILVCRGLRVSPEELRQALLHYE